MTSKLSISSFECVALLRILDTAGLETVQGILNTLTHETSENVPLKQQRDESMGGNGEILL
jgi:hypothetical protein